ncbi:competence protein ComEA [Cellulomonas sp. PhB150]|nr:competence protein ComEA [Cellulomonas sp. PhB150]
MPGPVAPAGPGTSGLGPPDVGASDVRPPDVGAPDVGTPDSWVPDRPAAHVLAEPVAAAAPGALDEIGHRIGAPSAQPARTGGPAPVAEAEVATARAMRAVRREYVEQHGDPLDRVERETGRRRWAVSWRAAGAAALALALVGGAVAVRAASVSAGPAVVLPVPSPEGTACAAACGPVSSAGSVGASGGPSSAPSSAATGSAEVVVHVVGAVHDHGIVRLPGGSRVGDAVDAAGGATRSADLDGLNLARVLVDGEQIVVPRTGESPAPTAAPPPSTDGQPGVAGGGLVDLNTADVAALDALPGIGPVLAQRIVDHRADHPFASVDQLEDVPGIGPALMASLGDLVRV